MEYRPLGTSGLKVSRLCLGCMSFGAPGPETRAWMLPETDSRAILRQALEYGINFFDTANFYAAGTSEEITGRALREMARRDEIVVATKACLPWRNAPNAGGLSRKALFQAIDDSLRRLGMDYVDLYQIHRWDYGTPIEETMEALHDIVKAGKARHIGASSMYAWQFAKAQHIAQINGWTRFISMQPQLNLLYREEEREMLPLCIDQGVGVIPWSPLARGRLTRSWHETTIRTQTDPYSKEIAEAAPADDRIIAERVDALAQSRGVTRAQVALAWVLAQPGITAPIVGATRPGHLDEAVAALTLTLTREETKDLEEHYTPRAVSGLASERPFTGRLSPLPQ